MTTLLPRFFYLTAALAWYLLLWRHPIAIFLAGCFACLTQPLYRRLRHNMRVRRKCRQHTAVQRKLRLPRFLSDHAPIYVYTVALLAAVFTPLATLILLVSPQAGAGLARLRELKANNFQLPAEWVNQLQQVRTYLGEYPRLEKMVYDFFRNLDTLLSDTVSLLFSRGFGVLDVLGGTMDVLWTLFLFFTLTVLFTVYSRRIRKITGRIFHWPQALLRRFTAAIHRALRAVMLGIALVAMIQGLLCGIAFAAAGFKQPAFWGMLTTFTAPLPVVGTAIVWLPLSLSLWFTGKTVAAVGLALWGALAVATVDNLLRPLFLRQGIHAPFFVLITAILCGLTGFGPVGLIVGPVLLAFAIQAVEEGNRFYRQRD
ncbi:AI-2E family transporter [Deltaproteobacteria bacterium]|nr:AI-2E family transporter [Deltaproteobacteria bacterium]